MPPGSGDGDNGRLSKPAKQTAQLSARLVGCRQQHLAAYGS